MHLANGGFFLFFIIFFLFLTTLVIFRLYRKNFLIARILSKGQENLLLSNLSQPARTIKTIILILALFFICFSLLDPRWGNKSLQASIEGIDVVLVTDVSRSMLTPDVPPSRLAVEKKLATQLMSLLLGNRIGLTAFAGFAFNVVPLTTDIDAATTFLNELSPDMIDVQGSNLEDALKKAITLFEKDALTHKVIVVFTDGEDFEFSPIAQAKAAANSGISIFTVGIGTPNGGQIPLYDEAGNQIDFLKKDGQIVTSRLNDKLLGEISADTKGLYFYGTEDAIVTLAQKLDEIKKSRFGNNVFEFMEPQYQYFLLIAFLLLSIYLFLPERRLPGKILQNIRLGNIFKIILPVLLVLTAANSAYTSDASRGTQEYRKGNYDEALKAFQKGIVKNPKNEKLRFNEGDSLYQQKDYNAAGSSFLSLTNSKDPRIQNKSLFNYGSTLLGKKDLPGAIDVFRNLLETEKKGSPIYKKSLQNLLYAKEQMNQSQNSNQQNQDQDKNKDDKQKKDQKQDQKQDQDKRNQDKKQQQQQAQEQAKPISPSEVENLLNLIQEEEKKHLSKKERDKNMRINPKNDW